MISFYILSKRFFLKRKGLFDARVASITKKYNFIESAKSRAWLACVLACFACLRACVLKCLACLRAYVLACLRAWRACVLACLRACVLGVLTCVYACYDEMFYFLMCLRTWCIYTWCDFLSYFLYISIHKFKNLQRKICVLC